MNERAKRRYLKAKLAAVEALGGRCSCALQGCWHSGACPISDHRVLQFDHVKGGGRPEQLDMGSGGIKRLRYYKRIAEGAKQGETKYQLLCANCNWMKRAILGI